MKKMLFISMLVMGVISASAYDLAVENADGVIIYYNYINDGTELEVTSGYSSSYCGVINIPDTVVFLNRTRRVTSIEKRAFEN